MRCVVRALLLVLASAAGASGGGWQFEQVDSAGWGLGIQARRLPDGRLCLCYRHANAALRYAYKDTTWHYEDIPDSGSFGFSVSPDGVPAVLCGSEYIERTDTGWVATTVPWTPSSPFLAHDSAGSPFYLLAASAPDTQLLIAVSRVEGEWLQDTAVMLVMPDEGLRADAMRSDALGRPVVLFDYYVIQGSLSYEYMNVAIRTDTGWVRDGVGSTMDGYFGPANLGFDQTGGWGVAVIVTGYLTDYWLCYSGVGGGGPIVRASEWTKLAVTLDSRHRPQIAYLQNEHPLLAWRDSSAWDTIVVPWYDWVAAVDIVTSDRDEPVIAMSTRDGVWLARADHVLGGSEERNPSPSRNRAGTVCRGFLNLAPALRSSTSGIALLDACGRRVMSLSPGPNDLSRLPAGVYHVRTRAGTVLERVILVR